MARWRSDVESESDLTPEQEERRLRNAAVNASVNERRQRILEQDRKNCEIAGSQSYRTDSHGQVIRHESPKGRIGRGGD